MQLKSGLFVILLLMSIFSYGQEIYKNDIAKIAVNFLNDFHQKSYSKSIISDIKPVEYQGKVVFYAVNLKNQSGYVLVSDNKASYPVLGYVPNENFDPSSTNYPQALRNLLSDYALQMGDIESRNLQPSDEITSLWKELESGGTQKGPSTSTGPLLTTIWSQGCYFNDSTPIDPGGPCQNAVTGCVVTAMGQVLNYHSWPPTGSGVHSYQSNYGKLTANFGATSYAWNLMADTLNSNTPAASVAAVAQLLSHCGIAVDMMYSGGSSGAYSEDALKAITHFFNYSTDIQMLYRDNYSDSVWRQMVMDELDSLRPLYYDGSGTGGHAFVCDGYQSNHYFHFNWGWNGSHNGWFLLTNLNPGGMNFGMYNSAFFGMKPQYPTACQSQTNVLANSFGSLNDGSSYQNYGNGANCSWLIQPQGAVSIRLEFLTFDLAAGDTVYVFDGTSSSATLIAKLFGDSLPSIINSGSGALYVNFKSDNSQNAAGWSASYLAEFCSGSTFLSASSGQVSDGSGSFLYNNNVNCSWLINPGLNSPVKLTFNEFKTEQGFDYLNVYDGSNANSTLLGSFDGHSLPPSLIATSGQMFIHFITDGGVVDEGWSASYVVCNALAAPISPSATGFCDYDSIQISSANHVDSLVWLRNGTIFSMDSSIYISDSAHYQLLSFRNGCDIDSSSIISFTVNQSPFPNLGSDTSLCVNFMFTSIDPYYLPFDTSNFHYSTYLWSTGDSMPYIDLMNYLPSPNTWDTTVVFWLDVLDSNRCAGADTISIRFEVCGSISTSQGYTFDIYPNPVEDFLTISHNVTESMIFSVSSLDGRELITKELHKLENFIDLRGLTSGVYFLKIVNQNGDTVIQGKKIIKL